MAPRDTVRPRLQEALALLDRFLQHYQGHLQPEEYTAIEAHLQETPLQEGYSVAEAWTPRQQVLYHWQKLGHEDRLAVLYELCTSLEDVP